VDLKDLGADAVEDEYLARKWKFDALHASGRRP
jgi:hypothetical protein